MPDFVTPGQPVEALWGNEVVAAVKAAVDTVMTMMPIGVCCPYGGGGEPTNWLLCRGQAVSTVTYTELYTVIGDRFNQGGPTVPAGTFRVPNMQGRMAVGVNNGSSWGMASFWSGGVGEVAGSFTPSLVNHNHGPHIHYLNPHDHDTGNSTLSFMERADAYNGDGNTLPWPQTPNSGTQFAWRERTGATPSAPAHSTQPSYSGLVDGIATDQPQIPPAIAFNWIIRAR